MIEQAYTLGEALGLQVWCEDEAGPCQTAPMPGTSWQPEGQPAVYPHEYIRDGTVKLLTRLHPRDGQVRVKGVVSCTNAMLLPWLQQELDDIVAALPPHTSRVEDEQAIWERWQACRSASRCRPPRHRCAYCSCWTTSSATRIRRLCWCFAPSILLLYTPLGGSWLNMAKSIQRILKRRALECTQPTTTAEIIAWLEAVAEGWYRHPTPFEWGGAPSSSGGMPKVAPEPARAAPSGDYAPLLTDGAGRDK